MPKPVAVVLKIPDNEAFSALQALQRAGLPVARIERSDVYADGRLTESRFNPNKHVRVAAGTAPRAGELWIEERDGDRTHRTAWRLLDEHGRPVEPTVLVAAADALLCNPAVERAIFPQ